MDIPALLEAFVSALLALLSGWFGAPFALFNGLF